nr:hypothetical protein L203_00597 [Cryptococcus depauperatus CBS 7841]
MAPTKKTTSAVAKKPTTHPTFLSMIQRDEERLQSMHPTESNITACKVLDNYDAAYHLVLAE